MQEADVAQAIATLQTQGKEPSINNLRTVIGHGSIRDITRHRRTLLPHLGRQSMPTPVVAAQPAPVASRAPAQSPARPVGPTPAPVVVEPLPPPVPLLVQAEQALQAALLAERQAQRAYHLATDLQERERCQQAWVAVRQQREHAASLVDARQRALTRLRAEIPGMRIAARRAVGELATLEDQVRRQLLKARREAHQAGEELERMITDLVMIAGAAALPSED